MQDTPLFCRSCEHSIVEGESYLHVVAISAVGHNEPLGTVHLECFKQYQGVADADPELLERMGQIVEGLLNLGRAS